MSGRGLEIRVGAVVLLAVALLVVGTMWFQRFAVALLVSEMPGKGQSNPPILRALRDQATAQIGETPG